MKKIIGIVIASLMFCNIGFAEMNLLEEDTIQGRPGFYRVATICVDGYKFVITKRGNNGVSLVQFFKVGAANIVFPDSQTPVVPRELISIPAEC